MPPLQLPPDVPLGLWWYALWISVHGILIYLFRLLGDPHGHLKTRADEETEARLPSLNEHLWRLVDESNQDPYDDVLNSASELTNLMQRIRSAGRPVLRYGWLRRNTSFGYLVSSLAILVALICGGIYLIQHPESGLTNLISIVAFSVLTIWSLWHLGKVIFYNFLIVRVSDED